MGSRRPAKARLAKIRLIIFDFDGVLTDNYVYVAENGERSKRFWVPDGVGVFLAHKFGLKMAIITGNDDGATRHRAEFLRIDTLRQGVYDKLPVYEEVTKQHGLTDDEVLYIGDDLPDCTVMRRVGIALAPADAHPTIKEVATWIGESPGGRGIVREAIDAILDAKGVEWP
ncbi:MAG TPA: HAD-IIIA family hydrolase [Acidobacteriota bacterium]|nr:HAD-IIIA family hydrolase [Acidobacteriota bacterium]